MVVPGQIDNWLGDNQACYGVFGPFKKSIREEDEAEGQRIEDVRDDVQVNSGGVGRDPRTFAKSTGWK